MSFFIGTYTVRAKSYCHHQFFNNFRTIVKNNPACIVDSTPGMRYARQLTIESNRIPRCEFIHQDIPDKAGYFFHNSVAGGVNLCRDRFLKTDAKYLLIIESDVIPPVDVLERMQKDILQLENKNWGILGALYYNGFHNYELTGLQESDCVLSGCTVYRRELLQSHPFRWSLENVKAFPDAWMSHDAFLAGYSKWNDHDIRCAHIK